MAYYHPPRSRVNHMTGVEESETLCGKNTTGMEWLKFHDDGDRPLCLKCNDRYHKQIRESHSSADMGPKPGVCVLDGGGLRFNGRCALHDSFNCEAIK